MKSILSDLSDDFASNHDKIISTILPFVKINLQINTNNGPFDSKIGGMPYLLSKESYPKSKKGKQLFFLAQINFAEMPPLKGFPEHGILQFFIADNTMFGLNFSKPYDQDSFRIIYHADISQNSVVDFSFLEDFKHTPFESGTSWSMKFETKESPVGLNDIRFIELLGSDFFSTFSNEWEARKTYNETFSAKGHKVGGYAHFTQEDPRMNGEEILLFQVDSDQGITWGDVGVANFFIKQSDLDNLDFSNVRYTWDCY